MTARASIVRAGVEIPEALIAEESQHHPAADAAEAREAAAHALAVRALLLDEARRSGVEARPERDAAGREETEDDALIRAHLSREIDVEPADRAQCREVYERHPERFRSPPLLMVRHILCAPAGEGDAALAAARDRAAAMIERIQAEPRAFERLARESSDCPSGKDGGALGQVQPGDLWPEIEAALDALAPGEVSAEPARSRAGWHVLRLDARAEGALLPFEHVEEDIRTWLDARAWSAAAGAHVRALVERARARGVALSLMDDGGTHAPPVSLGAILNGAPEAGGRAAAMLDGAEPALAERVREAAAAAGTPIEDFIRAEAVDFVRNADDGAWSTLISAAQDADDPVLASMLAILRTNHPPASRGLNLIRSR